MIKSGKGFNKALSVVKQYFTFCSLIVFSLPVMADEYRGFDLKLGPYLSSYDYSESGDVSIEGKLSGVIARYASYYNGTALFSDITYATNDLDYDGVGKIKNVGNKIYDLRGMIGRSFYFNDLYRFTPYLGLGVRHSITDSRQRISSVFIQGYKSQQSYVYNPIGIEYQTLMTDEIWSVGWRFEYDSLIVVKNTTRLGADDGYEKVKVSQINGHGYQLYISFQHFLNAHGGAIIIEPFYKYWKVSGTNDDELPHRTANHSSNEWGVALMVSF